jgi:hypothetical protein
VIRIRNRYGYRVGNSPYQGPPRRMICKRRSATFLAAPMQAYCPHCGFACVEEYGHVPASPQEPPANASVRPA